MKHVTSIFLFIASTLTFTAFSQAEIPTEQPTSGYYGRMSVGVLAGKQASSTLQFSNGYRFRHFEVGMGLGFERYAFGSYAPVFVESRYNFGKGATQPFIGISAGYLVALNQNIYHYPGNANNYTAGLSVGLAHYFTKHFGITTSIGYRVSLVPEPHYYNAWNSIPLADQDLHRAEVRIGIVFR